MIKGNPKLCRYITIFLTKFKNTWKVFGWKTFLGNRKYSQAWMDYIICGCDTDYEKINNKFPYYDQNLITENGDMNFQSYCQFTKDWYNEL